MNGLFAAPERFGLGLFEARQAGKTLRVEMHHSGCWLAADCGAVKPRP